MARFYVTTAIPYVNAEPHLGHALELVQADVLARHRRLRGQQVRFLTGTDDNALKNVTAACAAGAGVREFVDANASRFAALRDPLALSFDDFIRTSADPRHAAGAHWLAILVSAGLPLPAAVFVHEYLTVNGAKLSKSAGNAVSPAALAARFGTDAVRWWLLRDVARTADTDFTAARLASRASRDLANGLGNLVNRTLTLVHAYRAGGWVLRRAGQPVSWVPRATRCPGVSMRRWPASTSVPLPRSCARSWKAATGSPKRSGRGSWRARSRRVTPRPVSGWTPSLPNWSPPAGCSPGSCSRSCPGVPPACTASCCPAATSPRPPRRSRGSSWLVVR